MDKKAEELLTSPDVTSLVEQLIGSWGWILILAMGSFFFREAIHKCVEGFMIFFGHDFDNDDILYVSGRQARIVRVGIFKTVFYMTDRGSKMLVPNDRLKYLTVEKKLSKNGALPYLFKGSESGFLEQYLEEKGFELKAVEEHKKRVTITDAKESDVKKA
jgi:hypothetical protein